VGLLGRVLRLMTCQCVYLVGYSALWRVIAFIWMGTPAYDGSVRLFAWVLRFMTDQCVYLDGYTGLWRVCRFILKGTPVYEWSVDLFAWVTHIELHWMGKEIEYDSIDKELAWLVRQKWSSEWDLHCISCSTAYYI
jgi:hypothetical protein